MKGFILYVVLEVNMKYKFPSVLYWQMGKTFTQNLYLDETYNMYKGAFMFSMFVFLKTNSFGKKLT